MKSMILLSAVILVVPGGVHSLTVSANGASCTGLISVSSWSLSCGGESYCSPGDDVEASVTATFKQDLSDGVVFADASACITVAGVCTYTQTVASGESVDLCDAVDDGSDSCPSAGTYTMSLDGIHIPEFDEQSWMSTVNGKVMVTLYDEYSTQLAACTFKVATQSGSYSMAWTAAGAGAAALVVLLMRRRRATRTESEDCDLGYEVMPTPKGSVTV